MDNEPRPRSRSGLVIALLALLLVAAAAVIWWALPDADDDRPASQRLEVYGHVPEATLTESSGRPLSFADLEGKVWVADFIFTRCAGTCQVMSAQMAKLQKSLEDAGDVRLVSITVDPEYDTPEKLVEYGTFWKADTTRWYFLTGTKPQIEKIATEGFKLTLMEGTDPKEPIIHSTRFVLIDRKGNIRGYYDGLEKEHTQRLLTDVGTLMREEG